MSDFRRRLLIVADKSINTNDYLTVVALEDSLTAKLSLNACEYCVDGDGDWKTLPADTETETINSGQTLSFRGNLTPDYTNGIGTFTINKFHNLKGNCMSMLFGDDGKDRFSLSGKNAAFRKLFVNNVRLIDASKLVLPATTVSHLCYNEMFNGCTSLTTAPELPAKTLDANCYSTMFYNCTSLITAPKLLPAMILSSSCYQSMFNGCTSLTTVPELPATTLAQYCYRYMFSGCSKLNYIKMLATDINALGCLTNWVHGVASSGTFVKHPDMVDLVEGNSGIPTGWTVEDYVE